jgi:succinyl-diaminopimelate desuccinylase
VVKIGRRGSLNARISVAGRQGHAAYPHLADNAVHRILPLLGALAQARLDDGTEAFEPSSLQITTVDVGNAVTNVIPGSATARLNIRFNDLHSGAALTAWLERQIAAFAPGAKLEVSVAGESFRSEPGEGLALLLAAIEAETGAAPEQNTGGGTSDARFIARFCPVAEFGLVGATMHKVDEAVPVADLRRLSAVYARFITAFCS